MQPAKPPQSKTDPSSATGKAVKTAHRERHDGVVEAVNRANGRYNVNMSEATQWGTGAIARQKAWACALGGAYVMGLGMDIASTPLSDLHDLGRLRDFME